MAKPAHLLSRCHRPSVDASSTHHGRSVLQTALWETSCAAAAADDDDDDDVLKGAIAMGVP